MADHNHTLELYHPTRRMIKKGLHHTHLAMVVPDNNITSNVPTASQNPEHASTIQVDINMMARRKPLTPFASLPNTLPPKQCPSYASFTAKLVRSISPSLPCASAMSARASQSNSPINWQIPVPTRLDCSNASAMAIESSLNCEHSADPERLQHKHSIIFLNRSGAEVVSHLLPRLKAPSDSGQLA